MKFDIVRYALACSMKGIVKSKLLLGGHCWQAAHATYPTLLNVQSCWEIGGNVRKQMVYLVYRLSGRAVRAS